MQEKILCWIHKLKSPCVGEELNGGAHSVNSCFGQNLSRQICCHMTLRRSDSSNNKQPAGNILSAEEWARDWRVGLEYRRDGGGLSDRIPAWLANNGKMEWKFCLSAPAITLPSTLEWCNDLLPQTALTQSFCCNMSRRVTLSCILAHKAGTPVYRIQTFQKAHYWAEYKSRLGNTCLRISSF